MKTMDYGPNMLNIGQQYWRYYSIILFLVSIIPKTVTCTMFYCVKTKNHDMT